jgi:two-component system, NarL family, sensor histidine kinase BarA
VGSTPSIPLAGYYVALSTSTENTGKEINEIVFANIVFCFTKDSHRKYDVESLRALREYGNCAAAAIEKLEAFQERKDRIGDLSESIQLLGEQQERLRIVVESQPNLIWLLDAEGKIEYLNQRWPGATGRTYSEIIAEGWLNVLHPDDRERASELWHRSMKVEVPFYCEARIETVTGVRRWYLLHAIPITNSQGKTRHWIGSATDVDELKRRERGQDAIVRYVDLATGSHTKEELLRLTSQYIGEELADAATIALIGDDGTINCVEASTSIEEKADVLASMVRTFPILKDAQYGSARVVKTGKSQLVPQITKTIMSRLVRNAEHREALETLSLNSFMVVPVFASGRMLGTVTAMNISRSPLSNDELVILEQLAARFGLVYDMLDLRERLANPR